MNWNIFLASLRDTQFLVLTTWRKRDEEYKLQFKSSKQYEVYERRNSYFQLFHCENIDKLTMKIYQTFKM